LKRSGDLIDRMSLAFEPSQGSDFLSQGSDRSDVVCL
jgi:hypothetical protein